MKTKELQEIFHNVKVKSWIRNKWGQGVQEYAIELLKKLVENYDEIDNTIMLQKALLNGAESWTQYSEGGCSLIYNEDIAERLATKSEIKSRTNKRGELNNWANSREQWIDVQARALYQAYKRIKEVFNNWK